MTEATFAVLMLLVLGWAVASQSAAPGSTSPVRWSSWSRGTCWATRAGARSPWTLIRPSIHVLAELTLALLLFSDAARVNMSQLRRDIYFPARLLGIGLPLSVILGSLLAAWMFEDFSWALAGFVGATLAPTDAALSAQVINDERIPMRLRRALNVESGLNDGIATPIVVFTLAVAASQLGTTGHGDVLERRRAARARRGRPRRPRGRARQRRPHRGRLATALDRHRRPTPRDACGRPEQLRPRGGSRRQRVHRGVRRRDRVRMPRCRRTSPRWRTSSSCRSCWASSWRWPSGSCSAPRWCPLRSTTSPCRPSSTPCSA